MHDESQTPAETPEAQPPSTSAPHKRLTTPAEEAAETPEPLVREIMRTDVKIVAPETTIPAIARLMADHRLAGVPVVENGEVVGIVTEADIIARQVDVTVPLAYPFWDAVFIADAGRDFNLELRKVLASTARDLMTSPVINIRERATLSQLATLILDEKVNPVPVLDDDYHLVGIVSRADLVRMIASLENQEATS